MFCIVSMMVSSLSFIVKDSVSQQVGRDLLLGHIHLLLGLQIGQNLCLSAFIFCFAVDNYKTLKTSKRQDSLKGTK